MLKRLIANWVYGGYLAGFLLVMLAPILVRGWPPALAATFLCLPVYMLHQYEEHDSDRFRLFVNKKIGAARRGLSLAAVFVINVPGVWGIVAVSLWLAATINLGFGLIAGYLLLVNSTFHIAHAIIFRGYNPGLISAIVLFLPLGGYCVYTVQQAGAGTAIMHSVGAGTAIAIHAAIIVYALQKRPLQA